MCEQPLTIDDADDQLLDGLRRGDDEAWVVAVDRFSGLVRSIALRTGLRGVQADELTLDVFQELLEKAATIRSGKALTSWLTIVASRMAKRALRGRGRERPRGEIDGADERSPMHRGDEPDPLDVALAAERRLLLLEEVDRLRPRCRELIRALFFTAVAEGGDVPYERVAADLGMPIGSIGPTRARCLGQLAERLERRGLADV